MKSILQTKEWAEFKASQGFEILNLGEIFVHKRRLPLKQNFLYVPEISPDDITPTQIEELKKMAEGQNSIFARLELYGAYSENAEKLVKSMGFSKAFEEVQPKWRQFIDLTQTTGEILAQMKQKGRYNMKLAERRQVQVKSAAVGRNDSLNNESGKTIKIFHSLYQNTIDREKITGRSLDYFENMVDRFGQTDYIRIYTAKLGHEYLAAALVSFFGGVATYLYGGSSRRHKEVMAPYLMHWQIIKDAKAAGLETYDLHGRACPEDVPIENRGSSTASVGKKSSWAGITKFKEQFGGAPTELLGSYDYVAKPAMHQIFKIAERMRRKEN
jgi:lipid II:glycine glycyltransferase (peptidoglycan interpeptide bridge formation enzyme)